MTLILYRALCIIDSEPSISLRGLAKRLWPKSNAWDDRSFYPAASIVGRLVANGWIVKCFDKQGRREYRLSDKGDEQLDLYS